MNADFHPLFHHRARSYNRQSVKYLWKLWDSRTKS